MVLVKIKNSSHELQNIKLSVVIITFNEERNIANCIDSVRGIADEILVVDSFSTDATQSICKNKNVRFLQHIFEGYGAQKNWATAQAAHDFVLNIDADEMPDATLIEAIKNVKKSWTSDIYLFNRCNNYCGQWIRNGAWYPDRKPRLYDRRKAFWTNALVHETLEANPDATTSFLTGDLLHYSYQSVAEHLRQIDKYSTLGAQEAFSKNKKVTYTKIYLNPLWRFLRDYFFRLGILDGYFGWIIAKNTAHEVFLKYVKLNQLHKKKL
jgi:glycosyltransferase involved in cell wall biosynthesis